MTIDAAAVLAEVCGALQAGRPHDARAVIADRYPHVSVKAAGRQYTKRQCVQVFHRDGYIDRYSGQRLVFPGTLRLLSLLLPNELPFHPNWKMEACHPMWWELFPTIDHLIPVARGGADAELNWVSTSMLRNSAKSNWTLEELSWELHAPGDLTQWDGLTSWCLEHIARDPLALEGDSALRQWVSAALWVRPA